MFEFAQLFLHNAEMFCGTVAVVVIFLTYLYMMFGTDHHEP